MNILVFEDFRVTQLYPITLSRASFLVTCGSLRLLDLLRCLQGTIVGSVRPHLRDLLSEDFPDVLAGLPGTSPWTLVVNGRIAPTRSNFLQLQQLSRRTAPGHLLDGDTLVAAMLPTAWFERLDLETFAKSPTQIQRGEGMQPVSQEIELVNYPHDLVRINARCLSENIEFRLQREEYREIADGIFVASNKSSFDDVCFRSTKGPVLLGSDVALEPFSIISGPAYIGDNTRINAHAEIKDSTCIGPTCKIGGEVEASVIEAFTNKQHHGFLGHSYLGSWINLGAGTCNSDLKNTYGMVNMTYGDQRVDTQSQFVGCFLGDYVKSAINTSIFTGKTVGCGSLLYGFVTTNVPSFVNYARTFGAMTRIGEDVMITTQNRMFARRNKPQRPCDIQLIRDMYGLTQRDRAQLDDQPLDL